MHRPIGAVDVKKGKVVTLWTENRTKKVNDRSIRRNRYKNNGVRRKIVKRKIKIKESIRYEIRKLETTTRYKSGCRANVEVTESARDRQKKKTQLLFQCTHSCVLVHFGCHNFGCHNFGSHNFGCLLTLPSHSLSFLGCRDPVNTVVSRYSIIVFALRVPSGMEGGRAQWGEI